MLLLLLSSLLLTFPKILCDILFNHNIAIYNTFNTMNQVYIQNVSNTKQISNVYELILKSCKKM